MSSSVVRELVESFHTALETIQGPSESSTNFVKKVKKGSDFNSIIQRCVLELPNELCKFLKLTPGSNEQAHKAKRFSKIKGLVKSYLEDLTEILKNVSSKSILTILLKHLCEMLRFTPSFTSLIKPLLKVLLKFWSTAEADVRVIAFKCILRIACQNNKASLETILKLMYIKYVENSKFVSPNSMRGINFMRRSLVEIYLLDTSLSYNHAFLYIRQLAIQLRNAITIKKKEHYQSVYNWQFINSLKFWSELLPAAEKQSMLNQLIYPLVQIINTTITLIPTAQYYPLRFHCVQMLIDISQNTGLFIPSLPYILEVLSTYNFDKKHTTVSMKPISLICLLRMSKSQMQENGFKNSVIENVYRLILENAAKDSSYVFFPELYTPCIMRLKEFLKINHVAAFGKQMKQLLMKIEENSKFIDKERGKVPMDLKNLPEIKNWENRIKTDGTPMSKFYESWSKVYEEKLKIMVEKTEEDEDKDTDDRKSKYQKSNKGVKRKASERDDSDLDMPVELVEKMQKKKEKAKKKKMPKERKDVDVNLDESTGKGDVVRDVKLDDWD